MTVRWVLQHGNLIGGSLLAISAIVAAYNAGRSVRARTLDSWYESGAAEGRTSGYAEGYAEGRRDERAQRAAMPQQRRVGNGADQWPPDSTRPLPRLGNATMQFPSVRGGPS